MYEIDYLRVYLKENQITPRRVLQLLIGVCFLLIMFSSSISAAAYRVETKKILDETSKQMIFSYEFEEKIGVIYTASDRMVAGTAISLYNSLRIVYRSIDLIPVGNLEDVGAIDFSQYEILIYAFQTTVEGVEIGELVAWNNFASHLKSLPQMDHVLAMGNAAQLYRYLSPSNTNVWIEGTDQLDAQLAYLWAVWSVADILETRYAQYSDHANAGLNIRKLSLQFFANNAEALVQRSLQPVDTIGEENLQLKQERFEEMEKRFPRKMEPKFDIRDLPEEERPAMYITNSKDTTDDDLVGQIIGMLPLESGLQGPIGGIIDILLEIFISLVGDQINLSDDAMDMIETAFMAIEALLGFFSEGDISVESALSTLFELLQEMIPFPEEVKPFVHLIIDAIPLLRGDFSAISDIIGRLLDLIIPEDWQWFKTVITEILDVTVQIVTDMKNEGGNFLELLLSVISEKYLDVLVEKFFELIDVDVGEYIDGIKVFFKAIMDFLANFDFKKTIRDYLPELIGFVINTLGGGGSGASLISLEDAQTWSKVIGILMNLLMTAIGFVDEEVEIEEGVIEIKNNLASVLKDLLELIDLNIEEVTYAAEQIQNLIQQINNVISQAKELALQDVNEFVSNLETAISQTAFQFHSDPTENTKIKDMIVSGATMIAGAINGDFTNKDQLPNLNNTMDFLIDVVELMIGDIADDKELKIIKAVNNIIAIIAVISDKDELKQYISSTIEKFKQQFADPAALIDNTINFLLTGAENLNLNTDVLAKIRTFAEMGVGLFRIIMEAKDNNIQGILQALIQNIGMGLIERFSGVDISFVKDILEFVFPKFFGVDSSTLPKPHELVNNLLAQLGAVPGIDTEIAGLGIPNISGLGDLQNAMEGILNIIFSAKDIFTDGIRWLFGQLMDWLGGQIEQLINMLLDAITNALASTDLLPPEWSGSLPVGLGGFSLFSIGIELGLYPHFGFDESAFSDWMLDIVFGGLNPFSDVGKFFAKIFSFFELIPTFKAGFEIGGFGTEENPLMAFLLESLGLELEFSGKGWFELELFTLKGGVFDTDNFFKVIEWGFSFTITISRTFTLLDFLSGGTAGALNSIGEYIGLDAITVTVSFGIFLEVVKRAASATGPEEGSFTLKITIGLAVHLGIDLFIVGIAFDFSMEIILTFFQDLVAPTPLQIFLEIVLRFSVTLTFLFTDWEIAFEWKPLDPSPLELTPSDPEEQEESGAMGLDADSDGISDADELATPGLNPYAEDTDGDGLVDKFETQTSKTDPILPDSDGDGLDDFVEYHNTKTNPLQPDSDWDGLTDYEEAIIIGTNPLDTDTDEDGIDDFYEVNHAYDIKGITPSVEYVMIGGVKYFDRTDPLNPDTDGDGLIDGEEGEYGPFYGLDELYNETVGAGTDTPPLIFNGGYTHPLDNDTDDDTWEQLYDGTIAPSKAHAWVRTADDTWILTTDYWEVKGMPIIYMIEGEPVLNMTYTNPVNPDTDGDTGIGTYDRTGAPDGPHDDPPISEILNSDGYELSLDPPSDPCDADTDNDGLIDGLEGTRASYSNHTHYANPDTDGDGLGDMQEILLGSNPRNPDGDHDMVTDGDEYFKYGTNPAWDDTDYDGLTDGEELYWYHTNPFSIDSDGDRISDWMELYVYFTDPMDEDSDNDRLDDYEEIFIYRTKPDDYDTDSEEFNDLNNNYRYDGLEEWDPAYDENGNGVWDGDYLRDGDEVKGTYNGIKTDPLKWDTDLDSITYFVVYEGGKIDYTFRCSDGDELYWFGTNPTYGDTDLDGITDGWELYLGSGLIPDNVFQFYTISFPILLDPLSNDTDGDSILDGAELMIGNQSSLIYPYVGFFTLQPYNTSPVLADTDGDFLSDSEELGTYMTRPDNIDTDNDTLIDYDEIFFHLTNPLKNDTDSDGLLDANETTAVVPIKFEGDLNFKIMLLGPYNPTYPTLANDPDTDDDLLPDGAEIDPNGEFPYGTDPMKTDSLVNGTKDGLLFDSDHDGIPDGFEYFGDGPNGTIGPTTLIAGGGPFNPDSDHDGLIDGAEWVDYGTNITNWDTDNDFWSDGLEVLLDTDPLTWTNASEIYEKLDVYMSRYDLVVTSPIETTYTTEAVSVTAINLTTFSSVSYRFVEGPVSRDLEKMSYSERSHQYQSELLSLPKGAYLLEVIATRSDRSDLVQRIRFYMQTIPFDISLIIFSGIFGFSIVSLFLYLVDTASLQKLMFWRRKEGGLSS